MTLISWIGIELSARTQIILLSLEVLILAIFAVVALVAVYAGHGSETSVHISGDWFLPTGLTPAALSAGFLAGVFIYWGWDSAVSVNEETENSTVTPGRAAVISTVLLLAIYLVVTVAAQAYAGLGDKGLGLTNPDNSDDVLLGIGN